MAYLLIRHKVRNYAEWKRGYDGHLPVRRKAGLREKNLLRNIKNTKEVILLFQASDLKKAKAFVADRKLREVMHDAGVTDKPDIYFLR